MISLESIARELGLSRMTVSRALRGVPGVAAETRERVLETAKALGYRPSPLVSAWMNQVRSNRPAGFQSVIGYCLFARETWHRRLHLECRGYLQGAQEAAQEQGFRMETFWLEAKSFNPDRMRKIFFTRNITGLLLHPLSSISEKLHFRLDLSMWNHFKLVLLGGRLPRYHVDSVCFNHFDGMIDLLEALRRRGFTRPALALSLVADTQVRHAWSAAFSNRFVLRRKPAIPPIWMPRIPRKEAFFAWLQRESPDVVIGIEPFIPQWLQELEQETGQAPGFAHLDGEFSIHPRTKVMILQRSSQVGYEAAKQLMHSLTHHHEVKAIDARTISVRGEIVWL